MRLLSCLALVTSSTLLPAQDFDFKGVPADYAVTFATASTRGLKISDSSEAKAFKERLEKLVAEFDKSGQDGKAVQAAIKNATGFDLESGDNRFAGGFSVTQPEPSTADSSSADVTTAPSSRLTPPARTCRASGPARSRAGKPRN
jgi:hypothetical protein